MLLYHATHKHNVDGIRKHGLDPSRATGKRKAVWLHDEDLWTWAINHVCDRHKWERSEIVLFCVQVGSLPVKRSKHAGVYYVEGWVPTSQIHPPFSVEIVPFKKGT